MAEGHSTVSQTASSTHWQHPQNAACTNELYGPRSDFHLLTKNKM